MYLYISIYIYKCLGFNLTLTLSLRSTSSRILAWVIPDKNSYS